MPNNGNNFRHALAEYIRGWGEGLAVEEEKYIGWRFIGTPRKLDIVIMNPQNCRSMAIEAKLQETSGSAFEKLSYALDDCMAAPIPSIIVFSGRYIRDDMKAKLISSGHGIEVCYIDLRFIESMCRKMNVFFCPSSCGLFLFNVVRKKGLPAHW